MSASSASHRPIVDAEAATWQRAASSAARSGQLRFAALLPVRERVLGPEHPDTLTTRGHLAAWTGEAGNAAAACDQYAALLPVRERVLGLEHPATLATRASLARWTKRADDDAGRRPVSR